MGAHMNKAWYLVVLGLFGCAGIPDGIEPVRGFDVNRYLGTWYEIARLDHSFERGLSRCKATYAMRDDGGLSVLNTGFKDEDNEWKTAEGRAYFVETPDVGRLKVSFFRPFYGGYNIIELDKENYGWVLICGNNRDHLWVLSRTPVLDEGVRTALLERAEMRGFNTKALIWVEQGEVPGR